MKILIVAANIISHSPRGFRTAELADEFSRLGHSVTLYSALEAGKPLLVNDLKNILIKDLGKTKFKELKCRKGFVFSYVIKAINRLGNLLFDYPMIEYYFKTKKAIRNESGYDMMISIAFPYSIHWGCASIYKSKKQKLCKVWIADCGDPYMGVQMDTFKRLFYFKYIEKWFCNIADFITIPLEEAKNGYYKEFWHKIQIIPQGLDFSKIKIFDGVVKNSACTFIYAGSFIKGRRDPSVLLEHLVSLNIDFHFIVFTNESSEELLKPFQNKLNKKLEVRKFINRLDLIYLMSRADFLINFDNNIKVQLPSKLIDYSLTGRPILNITSGFDLNTVNEFLNGNYESQYRIENIERFNIKNVADQFLKLQEASCKKQLTE